MRKSLLIVLLSCLAAVSARTEGALIVAASANTSHAAKKLVSRFEELTGRRVKLTVGASGTIYSQIANGAPYDVFLSADPDYPKKLVETGLAEPESLHAYAIGQLVVWTRGGSRIALTPDLKSLLAPGVRKIAIANPAHAPYGRAGIDSLKYFGVYEQVKNRLVFGESVAQAVQFVESGAADVGLVSLSLVLAPELRSKGRYLVIPEDSHRRLEQTAVVLKNRAKTRSIAFLFLSFLQGPEGRAILKEYGYLLPEEGARKRP